MMNNAPAGCQHVNVMLSRAGSEPGAPVDKDSKTKEPSKDVPEKDRKEKAAKEAKETAESELGNKPKQPQGAGS